MVNISAIGRTQPAVAAPRGAAAGAAGFAVSPEGANVSGLAAAAPAAALDSLLQLQAFEDATTRDRQAKRHGQALLRALGELQRVLLGEGPLEDALGRLADLVATCPEAADPGLAGLVGSIMLRARVELARRGR